MLRTRGPSCSRDWTGLAIGCRQSRTWTRSNAGAVPRVLSGDATFGARSDGALTGVPVCSARGAWTGRQGELVFVHSSTERGHRPGVVVRGRIRPGRARVHGRTFDWQHGTDAVDRPIWTADGNPKSVLAGETATATLGLASRLIFYGQARRDVRSQRDYQGYDSPRRTGIRR